MEQEAAAYASEAERRLPKKAVRGTATDGHHEGGRPTQQLSRLAGMPYYRAVKGIRAVAPPPGIPQANLDPPDIPYADYPMMVYRDFLEGFIPLDPEFIETANGHLYPGHVIKARRRLYWHYGVYVGRRRVIHYSGATADRTGEITVRESDLDTFIGRSSRWVVVDFETRTYSYKDTIARARSRLGESRYSIFFRNCEHFAVWCATGVSRSKQVENALRVASDVGAAFILGLGPILARRVISKRLFSRKQRMPLPVSGSVEYFERYTVIPPRAAEEIINEYARADMAFHPPNLLAALSMAHWIYRGLAKKSRQCRHPNEKLTLAQSEVEKHVRPEHLGLVRESAQRLLQTPGFAEMSLEDMVGALVPKCADWLQGFFSDRLDWGDPPVRVPEQARERAAQILQSDFNFSPAEAEYLIFEGPLSSVCDEELTVAQTGLDPVTWTHVLRVRGTRKDGATMVVHYPLNDSVAVQRGFPSMDRLRKAVAAKAGRKQGWWPLLVTTLVTGVRRVIATLSGRTKLGGPERKH